MTTTTAPRIIATDDRRHAMIADCDIIVVAKQDDYEKDRRGLVVNRQSADGRVSITASDSTDRAVLFMNREEARLLAQAILDATA